jgi:hypothetical protein
MVRSYRTLCLLVAAFHLIDPESLGRRYNMFRSYGTHICNFDMNKEIFLSKGINGPKLYKTK